MKKLRKKRTLLGDIQNLVKQVRTGLARTVNNTMVATYFEIGRLIVEDEQEGKYRAEYAKETLKNLSEQLTKEFGMGFSVDNLENMRRFYLTYAEGSILQPTEKSETVSRISRTPFKLSWSHYVFLMRLSDDERRFYEIESAEQNWSLRELERQFDSSLYERLALSRNKAKVKELSQKGHLITKPQDLIKEPYVLEFLGLPEHESLSENDLESAIIGKVEHFLKELGKGFLFVKRQQRISFNEDHFYIDLIFYNRILRCFVLIDLKIGKLKHQDIGQMQMYVNYYDRKIKSPNENKTIGIVLCKSNNKTVVEFTLPKEQPQIFSSEYRLVLPSKTEFIRQLKNI